MNNKPFRYESSDEANKAIEKVTEIAHERFSSLFIRNEGGFVSPSDGIKIIKEPRLNHSQICAKSPRD